MTEINEAAKPVDGCAGYRFQSGTDQCISSACRRCWPGDPMCCECGLRLGTYENYQGQWFCQPCADGPAPEPEVSKADLLAALIRIEAMLVELTRPAPNYAEATITYPGQNRPNPERCRHCGEVIVSRVVAEGERYWQPGVELGMWHHAETDRQECHAPAEVPPVCTYCGGALRMQQGSGEYYYYCGKITGLWVHAETGSEDCPE